MTADFDSCLATWRSIVGDQGVVSDPAEVAVLAAATYQTEASVLAVVYPRTMDEVRRCVAAARQFNTAFYPVSTGKNWGLGSRSPTAERQVIFSLEKLNKILAFDEDLAYIRVEPGVTFNQVFNFLQDRKSNLMLDVTGAHGDTSIVGNAVERGHGLGLQADRFSYVTDFEVILSNGDVIHTGYSRFGAGHLASLSKWGVGPELQGLFSQSNLGIVTAMTLWLQPKPAALLPFFFGNDQLPTMAEAATKLARLRAGGTRISYRVFNDYRMLSFITRFPAGKHSPLLPEERQHMHEALGWQHSWYGLGCIYADSAEEALAVRGTITQALHKVDALAFFPQDRTEIVRTNSPTLSFGNGFLASIRAGFLGVPIAGVGMCYWRMAKHIPTGITPEKDGCGVIWLCPKVPATTSDIEAFVAIVERVCSAAGFEPNIGLLFPTSRSVDATVAILYDRSVAGADAAARDCHAALFEQLNKAEFLPYRLATQAMAWMPASNNDQILRAIKDLLDPQHLVAPGRYE